MWCGVVVRRSTLAIGRVGTVPWDTLAGVSRLVTFPDGTRVVGGRIMDAQADARTVVPDLGLYAHGSPEPSATSIGRLVNRVTGRPVHAGSWTPGWPVRWVHWPDMGVPADPSLAAAAIEDAFGRARAGERVELRCLGGMGRTGTMIACMVVLAGIPVAEAVSWVRTHYAPGAVERASQAAWVEWFAAQRTAARVP